MSYSFSSNSSLLFSFYRTTFITIYRSSLLFSASIFLFGYSICDHIYIGSEFRLQPPRKDVLPAMLHNMNNWSHNTLLFPILPIKIYPFHFSFYQRLPLKTKQNKTNKNDFSVLVAVCKEMEEKGLSKMSFFFLTTTMQTCHLSPTKFLERVCFFSFISKQYYFQGQPINFVSLLSTV